MKNADVLTISQLNFYIKSLIDGDGNLNGLLVVGEISNFTDHYQSGHFYFSLKDKNCTIKAVMFASYARRLRFRPENGMRVLVKARVSVYEPSGQYQLYVQDMQPDGLGALNLAFEQLKNRLANEGLFDVSRKKPLPAFPMKIGVVTSPTGAAIRDIRHVLSRRFPLAQIILSPVLVQGEEAAGQIAAAVESFNKKNEVDLLIVGRGGGSIEELWAFNEEIVARAVAFSKIPVISAVGHETDFTICDFAADLRAPTPSAAAELAVPDKREVKRALLVYRQMLEKNVRLRLKGCEVALKQLVQRNNLVSPVRMLENRKLQLAFLEKRLKDSVVELSFAKKEQLQRAAAKLQVLSPLKSLTRGYSFAVSKNGQILKSVQSVRESERFVLKMTDGEICCKVDERNG